MNSPHPPSPALGGDEVFRIHWVPGTDRLLGICHCGAEREFDDPADVWDWLLGHPDGHRPPADVPPIPAGAPEPAPATKEAL